MFIQTKYFIFVLLSSLLVFSFASAAPNGATTVTPTNISSGGLSGAAATDNAFAGNISEVVVYGLSNTQTWQGYFGNVSGAIRLADSSNAVMYNWTLANPSGEVYASTNGTIQWTNIQCFNFTANGSYSDDSGQAGATSLYGKNLSQIESQFNIAGDSADGVNETFTLIGAGTHDAFFVGSLAFSEGECRSTRIFDSTGAGVSDNFEEVLLYEPSTTSVVFTSILENNVNAFNNRSSDFEMLVLEDGHNGDTSSTPYYFFVELQ